MVLHNNMVRKKVRLVFFISTLLLFTIHSLTVAESPNLQTPAPVIHLADNLDEKDSLGWCIDTVGRGLAEQLHAHSCKPRGGDVQFSYTTESLNIQSVTYENKCVTIENEALYQVEDDATPVESKLDESNTGESNTGESVATTPLMLLDCIADDASQHFVYDDEALSFHPKNNLELCLSVGEVSRSAGPYMSRALQLDICSEIDVVLWQWVIVKDEN